MTVNESNITFEVVDAAVPPGEYGSADRASPYISLAYPDCDIANLRNPDEVVIHAPSIRVVVDYPVTGSFEFELTPGDGGTTFTRPALARAICDLYQRIYDEEDETAGGPTGHVPGLMNRAESQGKYGIWGHGLGDLVLHTVYRMSDGTYSLGIDS